MFKVKKGFNFFFIIMSVFFQSLAGILGKYAALSITNLTFIGIFTNIFYISALIFLVLQVIVWQQALRHFPLSVAYPCISLTNFIVLFSSAVLFNEDVTVANLIGLILVTIGIFMLFHNHEESP
jgi:undecaprenyl phosphate-alpha-L-ara4N flippase subunit ArnE